VEKKISITRLIATYTIGVFIIPVFLIAVGSNLLFWYYSKNEMVTKNEIFVKGITNKLEIILEGGKNSIFNIVLFEQMPDDSPVFKMRKDIFLNDIKRAGLFDYIVFYDSNGKVISTTKSLNSDSDFLYDQIAPLTKVGASKKSVFVSFVESPYSSRKLLAVYSYAMLNTNNIIVAGFIDFNKIVTMLNDYGIADNKYSLIIKDDDDSVLLNYKENNFVDPDINIRKFSERGSTFHTYNRNRFLISMCTLENYGWNVYLYENMSAIIKPMKTLQVLYSIVIVIGLIVALLGIIRFRKVFDVLTTISFQSAKVAHGDYSIEIENSIIKELNVVAINFRKMIKKIIMREKELKESETSYRKLVEENLDFIFRIDSDLHFTYISNSIEALLGYKNEDFRKNYRRYFSSYDLTFNAAKKIRSVFKGRDKSGQFNIEITHKNGYSIVLEVQIKPIFDKESIVEIQGVARDVTTRYIAEKENEYLSNYLFNLIETLPTSLVAVKNNGRITQVNSAACHLFKKSKYDLLEKRFEEVLPVLKRLTDANHEIFNTGKGVELTEKLIFDDYEGYFDVRIIPLIWEGHKGVLLLIEDITTRVIAEENLRQAQKMETIGTLAGGLAHDFNNILGGILGTVTMIEYAAINKKKITHISLKEDIDVLKDAVKKATDLTKQLLTLSKSHRVNKSVMDINEEMKKVVSICSKSFSKLVSIHAHYYKDQAMIKFSTTHFEQIALNLLFNAKDAIETKGGNGRIDIEIQKRTTGVNEKNLFNIPYGKQFWVIRVKDTGCGFSGDLKKVIFDPYFTTKEKGTGLGLTMTYNIIKQAGGFIDVVSESGKGTTFEVFIPYNETVSHLVVDQAVKKEKIEQGSGYVLHVDDEEFILTSTGKMLASCGYVVTSINNGKEAVKMFQARVDNIDLVILDINMPEMSGFEVFNHIREINPNARIIFSSALNPNPEEMLKFGIIEEINFIQKPYTIEEISGIVKHVLGQERKGKSEN